MSGAGSDAKLHDLLATLRGARGVDFSVYKQPTLTRRIAKRMHAVGAADYDAYSSYLKGHAEEYGRLFDTILINVTAFFRGPAAWNALSAKALPEIAARGTPIRAWSAGCASGEEAYTLAMLLAEEVGRNDFPERVRIFATDVDEAALAAARTAVYSQGDLEPVPPALREKYFEVAGSRHVVCPELRQAVVFGRHDLIQDPPILHLDLLVCRNTLMYFDAETQRRIFARFGFALRESGFLFLGRAEMLYSERHLFEPTDLKHRIFTRVAKPSREPMEPLMPPIATVGRPPLPILRSRRPRLQDLALEEAPLAVLVVDDAGTVVSASRRCRSLFGLTSQEIGRALRDLELSYHPLDLRSRIERAAAERTASSTKATLDLGDGSSRHLAVRVVPVLDGERPIGTIVVFEDVTDLSRLQDDLARSNRRFEAARREVQLTNEELGTTNEELQSSNEELQATNEELQSTNEELQAMNEELQSTNEELETTNREMHKRTDPLDGKNHFLQSVLASLRVGVVVLDRELKVLVWNDRCADLWGVRTEEALGEPFLGLDVGLPVEKLRAALRACLDDGNPGAPLITSGTNGRGKPIRCRTTCMPLRGPEHEVEGAILLIEKWRDEGAR